jgi:hypothetical protein
MIKGMMRDTLIITSFKHEAKRVSFGVYPSHRIVK